VENLLELCLRGVQEPAFWGLLARAVVVWAVPFGAQLLLLRRMNAERRARAWNALTWAVGLLHMPLNATTMIPFAWVTRPKRGLLPGVLALLYGVALAVPVLAAQLVLIGVVNVTLLNKPFFADS
jgi:hypothetical protein